MSTPEAPGPVPAPAPSKAQVFARRLFSTVLLWSVVLTAIFAGNEAVRRWVFLGLMVLLAAAGLAEFYGMVARRGLACFRHWGLAHGIALVVATFLALTSGAAGVPLPAHAAEVETAVLAACVVGLCVRQFLSKTHQAAGFTAMGTTLLGLLYVPWLLGFLQKINFHPGVEGRFYLLHFILVTKFSDLGAYCTGSLIGRHKMIPRLSPGKTWEGFAGAVVISTGTSLLFARLAGGHLAGMTPLHALVLGVVLSVAAVVGDLIESLFKREAGVKDSGRFFPGIGGILDLLDSLLFNAPIMYLYLRFVIRP